MKLKIYFFSAFTLFLLNLPFLDSLREFFGVVLAFVGILLNHFLLYRGVTSFVQVAAHEEVKQNPRPSTAFLYLKFLVLVVGLVGAMLLMGNKVLIPLADYIILLFILTFSLRRPL